MSALRAATRAAIYRLVDAGVPVAEVAERVRRSVGRVEGALRDRKVMRSALLAAQYAHVVRLEPEWVHTDTASRSPEELRALVAVMAAMLPRAVDPAEALQWLAPTAVRDLAGLEDWAESPPESEGAA